MSFPSYRCPSSSIAALVVACALAGCDPECAGPESAEGLWSIQGTVVEHEGGDDPLFPSYHSPVNAELPWSFAWQDGLDGPVAITIAGQPLTGSGQWNADACGAFQLQVAGSYEGPTGSTHGIEADLDLVVWDEVIDGSADWREVWTARGGQTGTFSADARLRGEPQ